MSLSCTLRAFSCTSDWHAHMVTDHEGEPRPGRGSGEGASPQGLAVSEQFLAIPAQERGQEYGGPTLGRILSAQWRDAFPSVTAEGQAHMRERRRVHGSNGWWVRSMSEGVLEPMVGVLGVGNHVSDRRLSSLPVSAVQRWGGIGCHPSANMSVGKHEPRFLGGPEMALGQRLPYSRGWASLTPWQEMAGTRETPGSGTHACEGG